MSRIGQLNELKALRDAVAALQAEVRALREKLDAMEPKRPKKKDAE